MTIISLTLCIESSPIILLLSYHHSIIIILLFFYGKDYDEDGNLIEQTIVDTKKVCSF